MSSPYAGKSSGGGSVYARPSASKRRSSYSAPASAKPPKKHGGGIIGTLKRIPKQAVVDVYDVATKTPGGIYKTAKTIVNPSVQAAKHGPNSRQVKKAERAQIGLGKSIAASTYQDLRHPLRHPGYTALDILGIASAGTGAALRVGAAGKAARAAEGVEKVSAGVKAAARRPLPEPRAITFKGETASKPASASPVVRVAQKAFDRLAQAPAFQDTPFIGAGAVVKHDLAKRTRFAEQQAKAPIGEFVQAAQQAGALKRTKAGRKVGGYTADALARQHALRVVAEGVSPAERIKFHSDMLNRPYKPSPRKNPEIAALRRADFEKGHREQIKLNRDTAKYVGVENGKPVLTDPHLRAAYDAMSRVAGGREEILNGLGKLSEETAAGRLNKPGKVLTGNPEFAGGEIRIKTVPSSKKKGVATPTPGQGTAGLVNVPQELGSLKHPYTGAAYKGGKIRNDVVKLQTEAALEAQRYYTLVSNHERLAALGNKIPQDVKHDIAVRVTHLPGEPTAAELRNRLETAQEDAVAEFSHGYEGLRQTIFPDTYNAEVAKKVGGIPGVVWVDKRLLGGLNERNPLIGFNDHGVLRGGVKVNDAINNASKLAILYLKPAYVVPNLLGNTAMNLVQQGFAYPKNVARAARLNASVGLRIANKVDQAMGEGLLGSLKSDVGPAAHATRAAAQFYGRAVDKYPRRTAFLHEAARHGFNTPEKLTKLFDDPAYAPQLEQVTKRANDAIIDYGDLNKTEQAIIRRTIFFYPWVKGATKWTVNFVADHPVQAAVATQMAKQGKAEQQKALGNEIPLWASGLIPTGGGQTINPSSISVLSTPADIGGQVAGMLPHTGAPRPDFANMLTPSLAIGHDILNGNYNDTQRFVQNLPLVRAAGSGPPSKSFPADDARTRLLLYLLGSGVVPRDTNVPALQKSYQNQFRRR